MGGVGAAAAQPWGHGHRTGKLPAVVPLLSLGATSLRLALSPWAQPGANPGVQNGQQEGFRAFPGCLCCSGICVSPDSFVIGDLHAPNQMDFPPGCLKSGISALESKQTKCVCGALAAAKGIFSCC